MNEEFVLIEIKFKDKSGENKDRRESFILTLEDYESLSDDAFKDYEFSIWYIDRIPTSSLEDIKCYL